MSAPEPTPDSRMRAPGIDVGEHQDRPEVLRIDDLRAARHLEDVLGERRPHRDEARALGAADRDAFVVADDRVVLDDAGVGVELRAGGERDEVAPLLVVDEEHAVAGGERPVHGAGSGSPSIGRRRPVARACSRQNAQRSPGVGAPHSRHAPSSALLFRRVAAEPVVARGRRTRTGTSPWRRASAPRSRSAPPCSRGAGCPRPSGTPRRCSRCRSARSTRRARARRAARAA